MTDNQQPLLHDMGYITPEWVKEHTWVPHDQQTVEQRKAAKERRDAEHIDGVIPF